MCWFSRGLQLPSGGWGRTPYAGSCGLGQPIQADDVLKRGPLTQQAHLKSMVKMSTMVMLGVLGTCIQVSLLNNNRGAVESYPKGGVRRRMEDRKDVKCPFETREYLLFLLSSIS